MIHRTLSLLLALLVISGVADGQQTSQERPSLVGKVTSKSGEPLSGVRVDISTAAPKVGRGIFCPSCYVDCGKWATTNAAGEFSLTQLDPQLKFRLVLTLPGHQSLQTKLIDPLAGALSLTLKERPNNVDPQRVVSGIVTHKGVPIVGALVNPHGAKKPGRRWGGRVEGVEPTVTDRKGYFEMVLPEDYLAVDIRVTGHGFCGQQLDLLEPGGEPLSISVTRGASVAGKLVHDGQPVAGMSVAVVQLERGATDGIFIAAVGDVTDQDGTFEFHYLPPDQRYCIYSVVGEANRSSSPFILSSKTFLAPTSGKTRNLGALDVRAPLAIRGRIQRTDGEPLPKNIKLTFGRDPAWDLVAIAVDADGSFEAAGLPPETYKIGVRASDLVVAADNLPFQMLGESSFGIHLDNTLDDLIIPVRGK